MVRLGVIGCGYWGPNLVRNFVEADGSEVRWICDLVPARTNAVSRRFPSIRATTRADEVINDPDVDAVVIATPVASHARLARQAMEAGKHVFIEKPMADSLAEARALQSMAAQRRLTLMVGHTFVYSAAVRKIREIMRAPAFGETYYYDSTRVNLGLFQHDVNVLWDLAAHDLAVILHLFDEVPTAVSAQGIAQIAGSPESMAFLTLFFPSRKIAHVNVNWLAPVKIRQTLIGGSRQMIVFNDLEPSEKVRVYDKGVQVNDHHELHKTLIDYRMGDMYAPHIEPSEALATEARHFIHCVTSRQTPLSGADAGVLVVDILEQATHSMKASGAPIELKAGK
jgi:predicted dehydrogenase